MQAERRTVTRTRHEWVLPSGCSAEEVDKAIVCARNYGRQKHRHPDGPLTVEARDDEIVIWWEEAGPAALPETTP